jgi:nucleoside-diphosphate-sugar epimerase
MKSAALIGGRGRLGQRLTEALRAAGVQCRDGTPDVFGDAGPFDHVFFLIDSYSRGATPEALAEYRDLAQRAVALAQRSGARLVYTSSASVYGGGAAPLREAPLPELELPFYGSAKRELERFFLRALPPEKVLILRPFNVYGPGLDKSLVSVLLQTARTEGIIRIHRPRLVRDYVHVDDLCAVVLRLLESGASGSFNIGSGTGVTNAELGSLVARALRGAAWQIECLDDSCDRYVADLTQLRAAVGDLRFRGLETGIEELARSLRA